MSPVAFAVLGVGYIGLLWWYSRACKKLQSDLESSYKAVMKSEAFALGLEIAKLSREKAQAIDALHLVVADAKKANKATREAVQINCLAIAAEEEAFWRCEGKLDRESAVAMVAVRIKEMK